VLQVYLPDVVRPGTKLQEAFLDVEREILDVDWTETLVDDRGLPDYEAVAVYGGLGQKGYNEFTVRTAIYREITNNNKT
jgi:hypothetical protein